MKKFIILILLILGSCTEPFDFFINDAYGTSYYVKSGGNDSNTGLSDGAAWAHHPWMSTWTGTVTLVPGDVVNMNRGNTWSISSPSGNYMTVGQSGSAGNYITTTSYGTGNKPLIKIATSTGYDIMYMDGKSYLKFDNLHFQHWTSTYTGTASNGIYMNGASNPCHDIVITNCELDDIPYGVIYGAVNCYNITIGDTTATATATITAYSNHIHDFGYVGILLNGCNPVNDESNFNVYYNYVHDVTKGGTNTYCVSFGINSGSHAYPKYVYARYNNIQNNPTWEPLECHGASYIYFQDNYIYNSMGGIRVMGNIQNGHGGADHQYVERNIIENPASQGSSSGTFIRETIYTVTPGFTATDIYIRDNICFYTTRPTTNLKYGIRCGQMDGMIISGNKIYNGGTSSNVAAIYFDDANGDPQGNKNITISKNFIKQFGGIDLWGAYIKGAVNITYNIIDKPVGIASMRITNSSLSSISAVTLYNNVFFNDDYASVFYTSSAGILIGGSFIAKNNIFGRATSGSVTYWRWGGAISGTFTCDNNLYWNTTSMTPFYIEGLVRSLAAWKVLGYDTHSPNTAVSLNPQFVNIGGYLLDTDFKLQSTSPAINAGVDVSLTTDYGGFTINGLPDIGAWELELPTIDPVVVMTTPVYAGTTQATCGGNVIYDGGGTVSSRGVCWDLTADPIITDSHTHDGSGSGTFTSFITGLLSNTTYHVRAYAVNEIGTGYGADIEFTTLDDTQPLEGNFFLFFNGKAVMNFEDSKWKIIMAK